MQNGYGGGKQASNYLAQRINGATPEELAAMLLEGAVRFLHQAAAAIKRRDIPERARLVNRVSLILDELLSMLNSEEGGEVVDRLHGIYIWWIKELFDGARLNQPERLEAITRQMVAMRSGWEQLATKERQAKLRQGAGAPAGAAAQASAPAPASFKVEGLVG